MAPGITPAAVAGTTAAMVLTLTACGGGGGGATIKSEGAPGPWASRTPAAASATPAVPGRAAAGAPSFDFPPDVEIVVDADRTGDSVKDAVLRDQADGLRAVYFALGKSDPRLPLLTRYLTETALEIWTRSITWGASEHLTVTGTLRFYDRKVSIRGADTAGVTFCEDQRYSYGRHTDTGHIDKTGVTKGGYVFHSVLMRKAEDGTWREATYDSQRGAARCMP